MPKPIDNHPKDFSSAAAAAGSETKAHVPASRRIYEVDSNDEMIINYKDTVVQFDDIQAVVLIYMEIWGWKQL